MAIFAFSFRNSKSNEIAFYLWETFIFMTFFLSSVIINIALYNQHASKPDEIMAYIILQTKLASGRNVAIFNKST